MGKNAAPYPLGKLKLYVCNRQKPGTLVPVQIVYTYHSRAIRRNTGIFVNPNDWNPKLHNGRGGLRTSYGRDYGIVNTRLLKQIEALDAKIIAWCDAHPRQMNLRILKALIDGAPEAREDKGIDFATYATDLLLAEKQRNKIGQSVYENGRSAMNIFGTFLKSEKLGTYKKDRIYVSEITSGLVEKYITWRQEFKENSDATINHALTPIMKACKRAASEGYISHQTNDAIQQMRITSTTSLECNTASNVKHLTKEQIQGVIDFYRRDTKTRRQEYVEMFLFAMHACGLRCSDILTLQWADIDLKARTIRKILVKTRNHNVIPLSEQAVAILEKWKGRHKRFVFGLLPDTFNLDDAESLLKYRNTKTRSINQSLAVVGENSQLPFPLTFHVARHTFAVQSLNSGIDLSQVSQLMGHGSSEITAKVYAHFLPETLHNSLEAIKLPTI